MEFHDRPSSANLATSRVVSSFGGKHVYDGVFSGSPSVKAKNAGMDDYGEIFRGSGGSIPVLDVAELKDRNFCPADAVRTSKIDYSKIFGGFGDDPDIGVPYEELVAKPKKPRKKSSPEIRVAARSESIGSQQVPSAEVASEPVDGVKQVNVLYNKTNPGCMNGANGTTHIAQLHAIPGYTRLIDDISPSDMTQGGKPVRSALHEAHLNSNVDPRMAEGKPPKKAVSGPLPDVGFKSMSGKDTAVRRKSSRSGSISGHMSFDGFEIGQGMNSSSPPNLSNNGNAGFFNSPIVMKAGASKSDVSEGADGSYSPPSFYEEVDANSAAAASAAAVRKAIEEAQVKIKFARDLMERKKEGLQNGLKPSFYNGLRNQKKEVKSAVSANRPEQEKAQKSSRKEDALKQASPGLTDYNARTPTQSTPHLGYQKKSIASNNIEEVRRTESTSGHAGDRLKEPVNEKAAAPIIENVGPVEDRSTKLEAEREDKAPALAFKWAGSVKEMAPFVDENGYREKMAPEESMKKAKEFSKESPAVEEAPPPTHEKVVRGQNLVERTFEFDTCAENIMLAQPEEAYNIMLAQPEEADNKPIVSCEVANCGSTLKIAQELEEIVDVQAQELKEKNYMMEQKEAEDCVEINTKQSEVCSQEEMDDVPHDQAREEMERKLDDIHGEEGNKEDWVECDEELEEDCQQENNENRENDFFVKVTQSKSGDVVTLDDPQDQEETEKSSRGECAQEVNEISMTQADTFEQVDTEVTQLEIEQTEEDKNLETAQQDLINQKNNCEPADDIYKQDETKNLDGSEEACRKENFEGVEVSPEGHSQNGRIMEVNEGFPVTEDIEKASKPSEDANVLEEEEDPETVRISQDHVELGTSKNQAVNITKTALMNENEAFSGETVCNFENEQNIFDVTKHKKPGGQENHTEEVSSGSDDIDENINESEIVTTSKDTVINYASSYEERWSDSGTRRRWDFKNCVRDVVCKLEENDEDMNQSEDNTDHEDDDYFESSSEERWVDTNGFDVETSQPCAFDGEGNTMESPKEEEADHSMDKNYEHQRALEEREAEDTSKREADVENELHIRREEAKEKEMEREKERIAVERAIREARERAFADARARAEKAAVERASSEAHQRLRAETQDRSGKASAENRERLEKASAGANKATEKVQEAKLRAERAAVERVTAEARKRALEKAVSETAASKARSKSEKFAAEKSTGAPKDGGISSSHYKGPCSSSSSRHPSSSNHAVSRSTERYNGASGELQRSKVSSEKDQRMAERAAKALAEKNTRELLAQKEQAERNRLAETLDAEVRRWSSGKERNLRALLSTLQYILGPDSGWQPIPLTELIPATAVKKAYRKATLFVHPDKLQQRGASTQQKYTCEKVFDLLKDAWNRYSAEER